MIRRCFLLLAFALASAGPGSTPPSPCVVPTDLRLPPLLSPLLDDRVTGRSPLHASAQGLVAATSPPPSGFPPPSAAAAAAAGAADEDVDFVGSLWLSCICLPLVGRLLPSFLCLSSGLLGLLLFDVVSPTLAERGCACAPPCVSALSGMGPRAVCDTAR